MQQLNVRIADDEAAALDRIAANCDGILTKSGVVRVLIRYAASTQWDPIKYLTGGAKVPAYRVGAGTSSSTATKAQPTNEATSETPVASKGLETSVHPSDISLGDGVGREREGTPRKPPCNRAVRDNLKPFAELIQDFWRIKGGSKGDRAWSLLQTELTKLQKQYGDAVVRQQIELAINGKWKGITEANYTRFLPKGLGGAPAQPETRHPASRVFTAKDFDNGPTTNPALKGLF